MEDPKGDMMDSPPSTFNGELSLHDHVCKLRFLLEEVSLNLRKVRTNRRSRVAAFHALEESQKSLLLTREVKHLLNSLKDTDFFEESVVFLGQLLFPEQELANVSVDMILANVFGLLVNKKDVGDAYRSFCALERDDGSYLLQLSVRVDKLGASIKV